MNNGITAEYHTGGCRSGTFNIDSDYFTFSLIEGMYRTEDGVGMQVNQGITTDQEKRIQEKCLEIHRLMREIQGIQEEHT